MWDICPTSRFDVKSCCGLQEQSTQYGEKTAFGGMADVQKRFDHYRMVFAFQQPPRKGESP